MARSGRCRLRRTAATGARHARRCRYRMSPAAPGRRCRRRRRTQPGPKPHRRSNRRRRPNQPRRRQRPSSTVGVASLRCRSADAGNAEGAGAGLAKRSPREGGDVYFRRLNLNEELNKHLTRYYSGGYGSPPSRHDTLEPPGRIFRDVMLRYERVDSEEPRIAVAVNVRAHFHRRGGSRKAEKERSFLVVGRSIGAKRAREREREQIAISLGGFEVDGMDVVGSGDIDVGKIVVLIR